MGREGEKALKKETAKDRLAKLLGLEVVKEETEKKEKIRQGNTEGVTEEEIQNFREFEAIVYYLQAPQLFHPRLCKQCGAPFLVSRLQVAYCSYNCIEYSIYANYGIKWTRSTDKEVMVKEVYGGNEPLWIRNVWTLQKALEKLLSLPEAQEALSQPPPSPPVGLGPPLPQSKPKPTPVKKKLSFS